jgi:hypothetical protein
VVVRRRDLANVAAQTQLAWPLDGDALEDLRWYLEDYLRAPFGVWEDRGPAVQGQLAGWGEAIFGSVFGPGPARDAYERARDWGAEVVLQSAEQAAARLLLWQVNLLWRRQIIDYLLLRAVRP